MGNSLHPCFSQDIMKILKPKANFTYAATLGEMVEEEIAASPAPTKPTKRIDEMTYADYQRGVAASFDLYRIR